MLQQDKPEDFVIGTGETHRVREFVEVAFSHVGLNWENHVVIDPKFCRPAEVELLLANPSKAWHRLGWKATMTFEELVTSMVDADISRWQSQASQSDDSTTSSPFKPRLFDTKAA